MPLSQYKKNLYRRVETFELADPKLFEDTVITENLCICTLKKDIADKYSWMELTLKSVDQRYIEYYRWNIEHYKGFIMKQSNYKPVSYFDTKLDFLETSRCFAAAGGGGFGSNGLGYRWNILHDYSSVNAGIGYIHFGTKLAKDNFCKWWYFGKKGERLASKTALGIHMGGSAGPNTRIAIPQIDWENISNNPLWKAGNYDDAVLSEMGLKYDSSIDAIISV